MMFTYQISHNPVKNDNINKFFNINQTQIATPESRKSIVREKHRPAFYGRRYSSDK